MDLRGRPGPSLLLGCAGASGEVADGKDKVTEEGSITVDDAK